MSGPLPSPLDRRFTLVTGKGGVGKSTVVALLALRAARAGRRTLVCELDARERLAALLGHPAVGPEVRRLEGTLHGVNIHPMHAMEEYALMKLRFRSLYKLVFDNPMVQSLVRFVPGMNDLLMFGKAFNHEREVDGQGLPAWDQVIVDAPATGHGLTFFRLPRVIRDAVPSGNMHREAAAMWDLMMDEQRTAIHLVTLPEELPVRETIELAGRLRDELALPMGHLFVNQVPEPMFDPESARDFARLVDRPTDPQLGVLWEVASARLGREALAATHLSTLRRLGMPTHVLPQMTQGVFGRSDMDQLLSHLPQVETP